MAGVIDPNQERPLVLLIEGTSPTVEGIVAILEEALRSVKAASFDDPQYQNAESVCLVSYGSSDGATGAESSVDLRIGP